MQLFEAFHEIDGHTGIKKYSLEIMKSTIQISLKG